MLSVQTVVVCADLALTWHSIDLTFQRVYLGLGHSIPHTHTHTHTLAGNSVGGKSLTTLDLLVYFPSEDHSSRSSIIAYPEAYI